MKLVFILPVENRILLDDKFINCLIQKKIDQNIIKYFYDMTKINIIIKP